MGGVGLDVEHANAGGRPQRVGDAGDDVRRRPSLMFGTHSMMAMGMSLSRVLGFH